jgi:hypothetical protein
MHSGSGRLLLLLPLLLLLATLCALGGGVSPPKPLG